MQTLHAWDFVAAHAMGMRLIAVSFDSYSSPVSSIGLATCSLSLLSSDALVTCAILLEQGRFVMVGPLGKIIRRYGTAESKAVEAAMKVLKIVGTIYMGIALIWWLMVATDESHRMQRTCYATCTMVTGLLWPYTIWSGTSGWKLKWDLP